MTAADDIVGTFAIACGEVAELLKSAPEGTSAWPLVVPRLVGADDETMKRVDYMLRHLAAPQAVPVAAFLAKALGSDVVVAPRKLLRKRGRKQAAPDPAPRAARLMVLFAVRPL